MPGFSMVAATSRMMCTASASSFSRSVSSYVVVMQGGVPFAGVTGPGRPVGKAAPATILPRLRRSAPTTGGRYSYRVGAEWRHCARSGPARAASPGTMEAGIGRVDALDDLRLPRALRRCRRPQRRGIVDGIRHSGLSRPDRRAAPQCADAVPHLRHRPGRAAPVLGAQPRRLAPDRAGASRTRGMSRSPRCSGAGLVDGDHHPERGRAAPGGRRDGRGRAARRSGPGRSAWAAGRSSRASALDARLRAANPDFEARVAAINPDGDADLDGADLGRIPDGRVPRLRRRPGQAGRRVLRRERPGRARASAATRWSRTRPRCSSWVRRSP